MTVEVPDDIRASARFECANAASTVFEKMGSHRTELHRVAQQVAAPDAPLRLHAARVCDDAGWMRTQHTSQSRSPQNKLLLKSRTGCGSKVGV